MTEETNHTLIIMRHGEYSQNTMSLSPKGEIDVAETTKKLVAQNNIPDLILYSPIKRAVETATIVKDVFYDLTNKNIPSIKEPKLSIKFERTKLDEIFIDNILNKDDNIKTLMFVTHAPNILYLNLSISNFPQSLKTAQTIKHEFITDQWCNAL